MFKFKFWKKQSTQVMMFGKMLYFQIVHKCFVSIIKSSTLVKLCTNSFKLSDISK